MTAPRCRTCGSELPGRDDRGCVSVTLPLLAKIDAYARRQGVTRHDATTRLIDRVLDVAEGKAS